MLVSLAVALLLAARCSSTFAQGTAFTYQGRLQDGGSPANGIYDLRSTIYDVASNGSAVAGPLTNSSVAVSNGLFTVTLNFGAGVFDGNARWLEIGVRTNGSTAEFDLLSPRQPLSATPYAIRAAQFGGPISDGQIPSTIPRVNEVVTFANQVNAASFAGNGSGLTNLDAGKLTHGTVSDARLSTNVARLNGPATFLGTVAAPAFVGDGAGLTGVNADNLNAGMLADGRLSANVALLNTNQIFTASNQFTGVVIATNANNLLSGTLTGNATTAGSFTGSLSGDVTGAQGSTVVSTVGGQSAGSIASGAALANNASSADTPNSIVRRDASGDFTAGAITADSFAGDGAGITNLDASSIATGMVDDSRLSSNIARNSQVWLLTGNSGIAGGNYLGTSDAQPMRIGVGGLPALTLGTDYSLATYSSSASGANAVALGTLSVATGEAAIALGYGADATNAHAIVIGENSVAGGWASIAIGQNNISTGYGSVALGGDNISTGNGSVALGRNSSATNDGAFVWNWGAEFPSTGSGQFLINAPGGVGIGTNAPQSALHVAGTVRAENFVGALSGNGMEISNLNAVNLTGTVPDSCLSANFPRSGQVWLVSGNSGIAGGNYLGTSDAQPMRIGVGGLPALTLGTDYSLASYSSSATGAKALALGNLASASGEAAVALGYATKATNSHAFAVGENSSAGGWASVAIGQNNSSIGYASVALGRNVSASGMASFALGQGAIATNNASFVWSDGGSFGSTSQGQFLIKASGGVGIGTNAPQSALHVVGSVTADHFAGDLSGNATTATTAGSFTGSLAGDVTGTQGSTVVSTVGGQSAASIASGVNLASTATSSNTPNTIVRRGPSGEFSAGAITATSLAGNGAGVTNVNATTAATAGDFTGLLAGDVTGAQGGTVVATVGGQTAANVASGALAANAATGANTANTIVKRGAAGEFSAGPITATSFSGNGSGLTLVDADRLDGQHGAYYQNADNLSAGTVADARLSANVARTNQVWLVNGNAGTTPGTHFMGTTDNRPLEFKVDNQGALRLEPNGTSPNVIGGFSGNIVSNGTVGAAIGGGGVSGYPNIISGNYATIGGGQSNINKGLYATIGGGAQNTCGNAWTTIGGGYRNTSSGLQATVGGGSGNASLGLAATVGGGLVNYNLGLAAVIGGGQYNTNAGQYATIPGGEDNFAGADYAFAAGRHAKANHQGAFVWADSTDADFTSTADNQFLIRATGGVGIGKTNPASALDVNGAVSATTFIGNFSGDGSELTSVNAGNVNAGTLSDTRLSTNVSLLGQSIESAEITDGTIVNADLSASAAIADGKLATIATPGKVADSALSGNVTKLGEFAWHDTTNLQISMTEYYGLHVADTVYHWVDLCGQELIWTSSGAYLSWGGAWMNSCDRNRKENFSAVNTREVLERVVRMPVREWNYKAEDPTTRHLGPVAQDFRAAFNLGADDTSICTVDADGVALAAIQGLNQKLETENAELKRRVERLEQLVQQLAK